MSRGGLRKRAWRSAAPPIPIVPAKRSKTVQRQTTPALSFSSGEAASRAVAIVDGRSAARARVPMRGGWRATASARSDTQIGSPSDYKNIEHDHSPGKKLFVWCSASSGERKRPYRRCSAPAEISPADNAHRRFARFLGRREQRRVPIKRPGLRPGHFRVSYSFYAKSFLIVVQPLFLVICFLAP